MNLKNIINTVKVTIIPVLFVVTLLSLHLMPDFIRSIAKICKNNNDVNKIPLRQLQENNHFSFHFNVQWY